jgi:hypothetical protein
VLCGWRPGASCSPRCRLPSHRLSHVVWCRSHLAAAGRAARQVRKGAAWCMTRGGRRAVQARTSTQDAATPCDHLRPCYVLCPMCRHALPKRAPNLMQFRSYASKQAALERGVDLVFCFANPIPGQECFSSRVTVQTLGGLSLVSTLLCTPHHPGGGCSACVASFHC